MKVEYTVADPTGNITILVEPGVPQEKQVEAASRLLKAEPLAEQVGFILPDNSCDISVRMGGGEFCGNATLSAAALFCSRTGKEGCVRVRMSGCENILRVGVSRSSDGYRGTVNMPVPLSVSKVTLPADGFSTELSLVDFGGIAHLVDINDSLRGDISRMRIREWCSLLGAEALGIMRYDPVFSYLEPLVYVRDIDTLYYEHSCASGTAALGAVLAAEKGAPASVAVSEPGGILEISAGEELLLTGNVRFPYKRTMVL